jgi:hypothetical protein
MPLWQSPTVTHRPVKCCAASLIRSRILSHQVPHLASITGRSVKPILAAGASAADRGSFQARLAGLPVT